MIRFIIKEMVFHIDNQRVTYFKTFDLDSPELEDYLSEEIGFNGRGERIIIGAEIREKS